MTNLSNVFLSHNFMHIGTAISVYSSYFMCVEQYQITNQHARYENFLQLLVIGSISLLFPIFIYFFSLRFISQIKSSDYTQKDN